VHQIDDDPQSGLVPLTDQAAETVCARAEARGATVEFVAPDGYHVPADALRRIIGMMTKPARPNPETEAS